MNVMEAIRHRRSVRDYRPEPIRDTVLGEVTEALRLAPSACNYQPWRFILVSDASLREEVAHACHDQMFIAQAPVIVVGCAFTQQAYPRMAGTGSSADIDIAIALDHLSLAAYEAGLGSCWLGAFDQNAVKQILGIPAEAKVVAMMTLGYPAESDRPTGNPNRKSRNEIFSQDRF